MKYPTNSGRAWSGLIVGLAAATTARGQACDHWERVHDVVPRTRDGLACMHDPTRGVTLVFGGSFSTTGTDPPLPSDTWEWTGAAWRRAEDLLVRPDGRLTHAMAVDPASGTVWLDGGFPLGTTNQFTRLWKYVPGAGWVAMSERATRPAFGACSEISLAWYGPRSSIVRYPVCLPNSPAGSLAEIGPTGVAEAVAPTGVDPLGYPREMRGWAMLTIPGATGDELWMFGGQGLSYSDDTWLARYVGPPGSGPHAYEWRRATGLVRPSGRRGALAVYDSTRRVVFLYGGLSRTGVRLPDAWEFDVQSMQWRLVSDQVHTGWNTSVQCAAFHPATGEVFAFFGNRLNSDTGDGDSGLGVHRWLGTRWEWLGTPGPGPDWWARIAYDSDADRVVLTGGAQSYSGPSWVFQHGNWRRLDPVLPFTRYLHATVYDPVRREVVLFGGRDGSSVLGDTHVLRGDTWTQIDTPGPSARRSHAMVFDSARGRVVLFGGQDASGAARGDTWVWDGGGWSQLPVAGPPARFMHSMAYDSRDDRIVLFGGLSYVGTLARPRNDTWEFDGSRWVQVDAPGPSPRQEAAAAYDPLRGHVVMFGGGVSVHTLPNFAEVNNEVWTYANRRWTRHADAVIEARRGHGVAFDAVRGGVLYYGGDSGQQEGSCGLVLLRSDAPTPRITADPAPTLARPGSDVTLEVVVEAPGASEFGWFKDGQPLQPSARIEGLGTSRLTIRDAVADDSGEYWASAGRMCGTAYSRSAGVYVRPACDADMNRDGSVDGADVEWFFRRFEDGSPLADLSEDGGVDGQDIERFFVLWEAGGC